jgi:hypothetical protein
MTWNYIGIDADPPRRVPLLLLFHGGHTMIGNANVQNAIAWTLIPEADTVKQSCQVILRGLPELRMIKCIIQEPGVYQELVTALVHYRDDELASFTDLVRALDRKAHNGTPCIDNYHH